MLKLAKFRIRKLALFSRKRNRETSKKGERKGVEASPPRPVESALERSRTRTGAPHSTSIPGIPPPPPRSPLFVRTQPASFLGCMAGWSEERRLGGGWLGRWLKNHHHHHGLPPSLPLLPSLSLSSFPLSPENISLICCERYRREPPSLPALPPASPLEEEEESPPSSFRRRRRKRRRRKRTLVFLPSLGSLLAENLIFLMFGEEEEREEEKGRARKQ